jgi:uracil-DNA glycosylase family 4
MTLEPQEYYEALAQLAWQVELGADEAIGEVAVNRYEEKAKPKVAKKPAAAVAAPVVAKEVDIASAAARLAAGCDDLDALRAAVETFEGCALKRGARNTVFSDGNPAARVMIVGEAPGRDEDREGKPFIGRSGQLLDKMLATIGLNRNAEDPDDAVYITNVLPWRPPQNRDPLDEEKAIMKPFLMRHIALAKPEVLLLVGNPSNQALLETEKGVTRLRGQWYSVAGIPALPLFHPAYLLRAPAQKKLAWADLLMLKAKLEEN